RKTRARVSHRRVQPDPVELVPEIVMFRNVAPARAQAVRAEQVLEAIVAVQKVEREPPGFGTGSARSILYIGDRPGDDPLDRAGFPIAVEIAFGKADVAEEHAFLEK